MEALYKFINPEAVYGLGIMLVHFMWQALVLALFLGIFLLISRRSSPVPRYYAAVITFFMLPVMSLYTFIRAYQSVEVAMAANADLAAQTGKHMITRSLTEHFLSLYSTYIPVIVFLWFIGITALLLKNLGGLILIQRLKHYYIKPVGDGISTLVDNIRENFAIRKNVAPMISTRVSSPMVIGHWKPVVLIPEVLTRELSEPEMKIVLQHELAHIKRNDFIINLFQLFIESLFFFHPATWWISRIIRNEREECCDALAAQTGDEKLILAKALTSIQEYQLKSSTMAVALLNKKSRLFNRIRSIFGNKPSSPSFREGVMVMLFVFVSVIFMSFVIARKSDDHEKKTWKTINTELPNGDYMYARIDSVGSIRELFINGEKMTQHDFRTYQPQVDSIQHYWENVLREDAYPHDTDQSAESNASVLTHENQQQTQVRNAGFNLNTNDKDGNVNMSADENGFKLNVGDGDNQVDMNFGENGGHMIIKENGKTTFQMNIGGSGNVKINVDTTNKKKTEELKEE